jgi:opacity protein-like surface antigen
MKKLAFVFAAALAFAAHGASAQDFARPGPYLTLNGVTAIETIDRDGRTDAGIGVSGRIGYRVSPLLAVEAQSDWSGDFVDGPLDLTSTTLTANAKVYLAQQRLQPYLLAGIGAQIADTNVSQSDTAFTARVGGGLDYYLSDRVGLTAEAAYVIPTHELHGFDYVSVGWGVFYRF